MKGKRLILMAVTLSTLLVLGRSSYSASDDLTRDLFDQGGDLGDQLVTDREEIKDILNDFVKARKTGTVSAHKRLVEVHLSDDYYWAGLDKAEKIAKEKKELKGDEDHLTNLRLDDFKINLYGSKASVDLTIQSDITFPTAGPFASLETPIHGTVEAIIYLDFVKEKDGWKIVAIKSGGMTATAAGGRRELLPIIKDFKVDTLSSVASSVSGNSSIHLSCTILPPTNLREIGELAVWAGLEWDKESVHPIHEGREEESLVSFVHDSDEAIEVDYTFPVDGQPTMYALPVTYKKGMDAIEVNVHAVVFTPQVKQGQIIAYALLIFAVPLADFQNK